MKLLRTDRSMSRMGTALCCAILIACCGGRAAADTLNELSSPPGYVLQTTYPFNGSLVTTAVATTYSKPHRFTHWTINSNRMSDELLRGRNPAVFVITNDTDATAWYIDEAVDDDADGVPDWFEIHYLEDTNSAAGVDEDADGFDLTGEYVSGCHPAIEDAIQTGGISRRRSRSALLVLDTQWHRYREYSDPPGFVDLEVVVSNGVAVVTTNCSGGIGDHIFAFWSVDGEWQEAGGRAVSEVTITVTSDVSAVANYVSSEEDSDADDVPDWYEYHFYGDLVNDADSDTDADGYDLSAEYSRDNHSQNFDSNHVGGISRRRSSSTAVYGPPYVGYVIESDPPGFIYESAFVTSGTEIVTTSAYGEDGGYMFAYWTVNGEREVNDGRAADPLSLVLTGNTSIVAHYFNSDEDNDLDGVADWYEWHYWGSISKGDGSDDDSDGYDLEEEYVRDLHPGLADSLQSGGISRRWSSPIVLDYQTLIVESPYGNALPAVGANLFPYGTPLDCAILDSPVVMGETQYVCYGWSGTTDVPASGSATNTSFVISNDSTIAWQWITNYWLDVTAGPNGSADQVDQWCLQNSNIVITATPDSNYHFDDWSGDTNGCVIAGTQITTPMDRARAIDASFALNLYDIASSAGANGSISPNGTVWVGHGSNETFTITPDAKYHVLDVEIDGGSIGPTAGYTFVNVTNARTIDATFEINSNSLAVTSDYGTPDPSVTVWHNEGVLAAASIAGSPLVVGDTQYVCVGWMGSGDAGSGGATNTSFVISNDSTIVWLWLTNYWLDVETDGSGDVDVVDGWYPSGTQIVVAAAATVGHYLSGWSGDVPVGAGTNNPLIVTMDMARVITAHFVTNPGTIAIDVEPNQGSWTITAFPATYFGQTAGTGDLASTLAPIGDYTVAYGELQLYRSPASQTLTVASDEAELFTGYYTGTGRRPKFVWTTMPGATWYRLYIKRNGSLYEDRWVNQTNSWWIPDVDYPGGNYTWWVQGYGPAVGKGAWAAGTPFTIGARTPGKVAQGIPSGVADTNSPLFSWSVDTNATYYGVWMNRDGAFYHKIWLEGATSYVHATDLPYGTYDWWVRTWCVDGYGDWSDGLNFTYGISTLLNPVGAIATNKPSFDWAAVDAADWYRLYISHNGSLHHSHWTNAPNTNWLSGTAMPGGSYSWWIQTWNPDTSIWSPRTDFTIP